MNALRLPDAELAGLEILERLATPVWLIRCAGDLGAQLVCTGANVCEDFAVCDGSPCGETMWINAAARTLLDAPPEAPPAAFRLERTADALCALTAVAVGQMAQASLRFCREGARPVEVEARLSSAPCTDSLGRPLILVEATTDATARREVMLLTEQLVALSYAYPDVRFELRRDGTILDFATASPAELNVPAERFLKARVQDVLPEPAAGLIAAALGRLDEGDTVAGVDFVLPAPPESPQAGEKSFEARLVALLDGNRVLCSIRNVTERVRAEREARRAHDLLIDAIECITEGFVLYDAQDRLVLSNSHYRALFSANADLTAPGTPFETVLREGARRSLYQVAPDKLEAWVEERLIQHRTAGAPIEVQLSSGRWLRIEEWRTQEGGTVGIRADITDLKRREAELQAARDEAERANRRKSDYVQHLSHELRTPLNAVLGFAQIIRDQVLGPTDLRYPGYAGQIAAAGVYMLDLINNLLDLAKIEAGRMILHEEPCDLTLLVELTFGMMEPRAGEGAVALVMDIPDDLPNVRGDASLIRQMLTNLVGNAVKFARPPDARVTVRAERTADGGIVLSVSDNGVGMSPEQIPVALTAFGQAHDREVACERGSGLGLPLTRALIALHGGDFAIESVLGGGTTVRLSFPPSRSVGKDDDWDI